jgi:hypothetical protein
VYAFTIIEAENEFQARIARIFLEADGYPSVAASVKVDERTAHACLTAAPEGAPEMFERAIKRFAAHGERGVEMARAIAANPLAKLAGAANPRQVPAPLRDAVRNALLHTLYTAAQEENSAVVFSDPAYSSLAVPTTVNDGPTAPVKNPSGGGFDGECRGVDVLRAGVDHDPGDESRDSGDSYDNWKPGRNTTSTPYYGG